jgi:hypothetical protein
MNEPNKQGVRLLEHLFVGGSTKNKGVANEYCLNSGMSNQMGKIPRFFASWGGASWRNARCAEDDICDDIALLLNEVISSGEE